MTWNVYNYDINKRAITTFDVFKHGSFKSDVDECLKSHDDISEFSKQLRQTVMHYFAHRAEYEIVISAWPPYNGTESERIDIAGQLMMNWNTFVNYVWSFKTDSKSKKGL